MAHRRVAFATGRVQSPRQGQLMNNGAQPETCTRVGGPCETGWGVRRSTPAPREAGPGDHPGRANGWAPGWEQVRSATANFGVQVPISYQAAQKTKLVHHVRGTTATRIMSLRCGSSHLALGAGKGDQVQLLDLPAPWRTLGVLRVRNRSDRRPSGEYGRVHLGWQDASQFTLQDLRLRHALGTACSRARRQARSQSEQFWSAPSRVRSDPPVRWSGHLEIHRLRGAAEVPPNPSILWGIQTDVRPVAQRAI